LVHRQDRAEVPHRHRVAVDGAVLAVAAFVGRQVRHDLVAVEIEVNPFGCAAAFRAAEQLAVERAGLGDVAHRERQVERNALGGRGHEDLDRGSWNTHHSRQHPA
jgi:ADP-ribosylglycohydrolase